MTRHLTAREIADDLEARIRTGEYPPDSQLLYADMVELYTTSKSTMQRVMERLEERGIVEYRPGRGRFVREPPVD